MEVGKQIGRRIYLHVSARAFLDEKMSALLTRALDIKKVPPKDFNVLRIDVETRTIALLDYPSFFESPFPTLARAWNVRVDAGEWSHRNYEQSSNPPILHRKELLLAPDDARAAPFRALTAELENLGFFDDTVRIGFQLQWNALLHQRIPPAWAACTLKI